MGLVDVLRRLGIELEGRKDDNLGLGDEGLRLLDGAGDLPLLHRRMIWPERDGEALGIVGGAFLSKIFGSGIVGPCLPLGVKPPGSGQRLQPRERDSLPGLAANAGLEKLVAPIALAQRLARARDRSVVSLG